MITNLIISSNMDPDYNDIGESNVHRALIFQGGGSLGAYEAGAYKAISEELSTFYQKTL
jgi:predicted acylesterase/phospholipase RssA